MFGHGGGIGVLPGIDDANGGSAALLMESSTSVGITIRGP